MLKPSEIKLPINITVKGHCQLIGKYPTGYHGWICDTDDPKSQKFPFWSQIKIEPGEHTVRGSIKSSSLESYALHIQEVLNGSTV